MDESGCMGIHSGLGLWKQYVMQKWMQMPLYLNLSIVLSFQMVIEQQSARIRIKHMKIRIRSFMHA